jgi:DNA-binding GntR family transcriptional regulator
LLKKQPGGGIAGMRSSKKYESKRAGASVDIAFEEIKKMLYNNEIAPGQKLIYHDLTKKLNMSVTPIAQALKKLEFLNLVCWERNRGYRVGEINATEVKELFSAREALEIYVVPEVVAKLSRKKTEEIASAMSEHIKGASLPQSRRLLMIKDLNFHLKIVECAENRIIHSTCRRIFEQIYLKYKSEFMLESRINEASQEHENILNALTDGDVERTRRLLTKHIHKGRKHIIDSLFQDRENMASLERFGV